MATTSQKMMEMRFLVRMRGARTPAPRIDEPVMKMPLYGVHRVNSWPCDWTRIGFIYHAAPTTDNPIHSPIPRSAQTYGDIDSRKAPTCLLRRQCENAATEDGGLRGG